MDTVSNQIDEANSSIEKTIQLLKKYNVTDSLKMENFEPLMKKLCEIETTDKTYKLAFVHANEKSTQKEFDKEFKKIQTLNINRSNYTSNPRYIRCQQLIKEYSKPTAQSSLNNSMEEEDIAITGTAIASTDPFTKKRLVHPIVNRHCSHVYEKSTIFELISNSRKTKCPVVGCNNKRIIERSHLYEDIDVIAQIRTQQNEDDNAQSSQDSIAELDASSIRI